MLLCRRSTDMCLLRSPFADRIAGVVLLCGRPPGFGSEALFGTGVLLRNAGDSGEERGGKVVRGVVVVVVVVIGGVGDGVGGGGGGGSSVGDVGGAVVVLVMVRLLAPSASRKQILCKGRGGGSSPKFSLVF